MEDIHEQVDVHGRRWIHVWGKGLLYMVKMYLHLEMYTIFDDFIRINESGIKKTTCINFVTV
jgi:hypothetical protein